MLDNRDGNAFTDKPFFNTNFIWLNNIKSITGEYTYKRAGEVIKSTPYKYVYQFDTVGRLSATLETRADDGSRDTNWNCYTYNRQGRITDHRRGDGRNFNTIHYVYDTNARAVMEYYSHEFRDTLNLPQTTVINTESMQYVVGDSMVKKTVYNSYNLPYLEEITYYDRKGYVKERQQWLIVTKGSTRYTYTYNERGFLAGVRIFGQGESIPFEEKKFLYDSFGNLEEIQFYREGNYVTETEMIYNEKTKLLRYVLTRDVATNFIGILDFKDYEFW